VTDHDHTAQNDLRERALLPVLIPVVTIIVVELLVFSVSRVLLATGKLTAVGVALAIAVAILVGAAAIANAERVKTASVVGLLVLAGLAALVAGAAAAQKGPFYGDEPAHTEAKGVEVSAKSLAFDTKKLDLPATNAAITLKNEDTQPHNIAIFKSKTTLNAPVFRGKNAEAGKTEVYEIGALTAGVLYFHCDIHPTMNGQVVVT
jgi:plastocyanin